MERDRDLQPALVKNLNSLTNWICFLGALVTMAMNEYFSASLSSLACFGSSLTARAAAAH